MSHSTVSRLIAAVCLSAFLGGCGAGDRLANVGKAPALTAIQDPTTQPGYRPVQMPMPDPVPVHRSSNSLWATGTRAFFKDQRASKVGDILTVQVVIADRAEIDNQTARSRTSTEAAGAGGAVGNALNTLILPASSSADVLGTVDSNSNYAGAGSVDREETLRTTVAAVVTQVLPNGNMVIEGRQEVRVNFEVRELVIAGVIRPEDIASDNTIDSSVIAEARLAYGGRGQITDVQQPRYGTQVLDIFMPF
ncbi:MAG: flagellar basal body L-ring protein FlgH [Stappiaceae bacterium]